MSKNPQDKDNLQGPAAHADRDTDGDTKSKDTKAPKPQAKGGPLGAGAKDRNADKDIAETKEQQVSEGKRDVDAKSTNSDAKAAHRDRVENDALVSPEQKFLSLEEREAKTAAEYKKTADAEKESREVSSGPAEADREDEVVAPQRSSVRRATKS